MLKPPDLYAALSIFASISQMVDDAAASSLRDVYTLVLLTSHFELAPYVQSNEPVQYWPKKLRNAFAHSQVKLIGKPCCVVGYNRPDTAAKHFSFTVRVPTMVDFFHRMFSDIETFLQCPERGASESKAAKRPAGVPLHILSETEKGPGFSKTRPVNADPTRRAAAEAGPASEDEDSLGSDAEDIESSDS